MPEPIETEPRNVIGDIAGNYLTLKALLAQMPPGIPLSVGDMVDRGPRSREVIEFFMASTPDAPREALMGNHEHLMYADLTGTMRKNGYHPHDWRRNGAGATLESYGASRVPNMYGLLDDFVGYTVPQSHLDWLAKLPVSRLLRYGDRSFFVSHAPQSPRSVKDYSFVDQIWNREAPQRLPGVDFAIYGHNAKFRYEADAAGAFALCIDVSNERYPKMLCGMHLPTMELFFQEVID